MRGGQVAGNCGGASWRHSLFFLWKASPDLPCLFWKSAGLGSNSACIFNRISGGEQSSGRAKLCAGWLEGSFDKWLLCSWQHSFCLLWRKIPGWEFAVTWKVALAFSAGVAAGYLRFIPGLSPGRAEFALTLILVFLVFGIGVEIASNHSALELVKKMGWRSLLLPALSMAGTVMFSALVGFLSGLSPFEGAALGCGFGWYSLSGVLITPILGASLGVVAFLSNIFREILTFLGAEVVYRRLGSWPAVAMGGATSMDTTLPLLSSISAGKLDTLAMISGVVHSLAVPVLVPLFASLAK